MVIQSKPQTSDKCCTPKTSLTVASGLEHICQARAADCDRYAESQPTQPAAYRHLVHHVLLHLYRHLVDVMLVVVVHECVLKHEHQVALELVSAADLTRKRTEKMRTKTVCNRLPPEKTSATTGG